MNSYTVKKGKHSFQPMPFPKIWTGTKKAFGGTASFSESCIYDWGNDKDQKDFNKLCGAALSLFAPKHWNSAMIGWRWNPQRSVFEVAPYFNRKKAVIIGDIISVQPNEEFTFLISQNGKQWTTTLVTADGNSSTKTVDYAINSALTTNVHAWFGGANNEEGEFGGVASHDMTLSYEMQRVA